MPREDLPPPPKPDKADVLHRIEKAALSLTPPTGVIAELFGLLESPLERRRAQWFERLWEALRELEQRVAGFTVDSLGENEQFVTAVLHATQMAIRSHQEEKLDALRNAVLNVAAGSTLDEDVQLAFLGAVDALTPSHIRLLQSLRTPDHNAAHILPGRVSAHQDILGSSYLRPAEVQLARDLQMRGFISVDVSEDDNSRAHWDVRIEATDLGKGFLDFVQAPTGSAQTLT